jgi:hypothetical protein
MKNANFLTLIIGLALILASVPMFIFINHSNTLVVEAHNLKELNLKDTKKIEDIYVSKAFTYLKERNYNVVFKNKELRESVWHLIFSTNSNKEVIVHIDATSGEVLFVDREGHKPVFNH